MKESVVHFQLAEQNAKPMQLVPLLNIIQQHVCKKEMFRNYLVIDLPMFALTFGLGFLRQDVALCDNCGQADPNAAQVYHANCQVPPAPTFYIVHNIKVINYTSWWV